MRGPGVTLLQKMLAKDPQVYPESRITGYFGPLTLQAVKRFQRKYADEVLHPAGYTQPTGVVGPRTQQKLTELYSR